jgi:hypothetical protein
VVGVMFDSLGGTSARASGTDAPQLVRLATHRFHLTLIASMLLGWSERSHL